MSMALDCQQALPALASLERAPRADEPEQEEAGEAKREFQPQQLRQRLKANGITEALLDLSVCWLVEP